MHAQRNMITVNIGENEELCSTGLIERHTWHSWAEEAAARTSAGETKSEKNRTKKKRFAAIGRRAETRRTGGRESQRGQKLLHENK